MDKYTRDEDRRFTLRINRELFERIELDAKENKRSVGRHIEYLLDKYYFRNEYIEQEMQELREMGRKFAADINSRSKHP